MSASNATTPAATLRPAARPAWSAWLTPSLADLLLLAFVLWLVAFTNSGAPSGLLKDAGTGVHVRTGELILADGAIPTQDIWSFSRPGAPWFAWEWLCDILFYGVYAVGGWKAIVLGSVAVLAALLWVTLRRMTALGATALPALFVIHMVVATASVHFLARPHILTLLLMAASLWMLDWDARRPTWHVWLLIPLTALWVNLHGGFAGLVVSVGAMAAGALLAREWKQMVRYGALAAGCLAASFANPYGYHLHGHLVQFMNSAWVREMNEEFQPPEWQSAAGVYLVALLILSAVACVRLLRERRSGPALLMAAWGYAAITSIRHVPIFAIVAAPWVAREMSLWLAAGQGSRKSLLGILNELSEEYRPAIGRTSVLVPVALVVLGLSGLGFPTDFPNGRFPVDAVSKYRNELEGKRLFTNDAWGDYLITHHYSGRVFLDGRGDLFGPAVYDEYLSILQARPNAKTLLDAYDVNAVLVDETAAVGGLLRTLPEWEARPAVNGVVLFVRRPA